MYCFEAPSLQFSVVLDIKALVLILWYYIANACWFNNTYHNGEETIGNMLTNGQTDGHCQS